MSNMLITMLLLIGVAAIFAVGSLVAHLSRIDHKYTEMMDKGGNVPIDDSDRTTRKSDNTDKKILTKV